MNNITKTTLFYSFVRFYFSFIFRRWFSKIEVNGDVRIPEDEPVIFAPNHQNALFDALALLSTTPAPVAYWVRGDLFKNKWVAKLFYALKLMPAYRKRNGLSNLKKNDESFANSLKILTNKQYLCLMPEGGQIEERKLHPLVKGIFRNAFSAQDLLGEDDWVKIIPVGIDYGDYDKSGRHLIVNYGKPISIKDYYDEYKDNPSVTINQIRTDLTNRIKSLMLDIQSEKYYSTIYTASYVYNYPMLDILRLSDNATNRLIARKKIVEILELAEIENDPLLEKLTNECKLWNKRYKRTDLCAQTQEWDSWDLNLIIQILYLIITIPLFLYSVIFNLIPYILCKLIGKKVRGTGFEATIKLGIAGLLFPIVYLITSIVFAFNYSTDTMTSFVFTLSLPISFLFFIRYTWKFTEVKERLRNIFRKPTEGNRIISIMQQIVSKYKK